MSAHRGAGAHKFSKNLTGDLKILGARSVTSRRKLHTENPQISGATVQKFGHPEFVHRWLKEQRGYICKRSWKRRTAHSQQRCRWISLNTGKHKGTRRRKTDSGFRWYNWETNTGVKTIKWKTRSRWNYKKQNKCRAFMLPAISNTSSLSVFTKCEKIKFDIRDNQFWSSNSETYHQWWWQHTP